MKKVTIAFDVDGTLISNRHHHSNPDRAGDPIVANERIRSLLITLASFKNVKIIVWSGGGELYAHQVAGVIGIDKYVDTYATKNHLGKDEDGVHHFRPDIVPDIVIDDIQECKLGIFNLIVKEK